MKSRNFCAFCKISINHKVYIDIMRTNLKTGGIKVDIETLERDARESLRMAICAEMVELTV